MKSHVSFSWNTHNERINLDAAARCEFCATRYTEQGWCVTTRDLRAKQGRVPWVPVWCLAIATSLVALVFGLRILGHFWVLNGFGIGGAEFLLLPLVFVPLLVIALTIGGRPSQRAILLVVVVCLVVVLLGLAVCRLIGQTSVGNGNWYRGPGSWYEVAADAS